MNQFSTSEILARTLYGEARGEVFKCGKAALFAVGFVILNRLNKKSWYGKTIEEICLKPYQFSCWNKEDPNYPTLSQLKIYDGIYDLCQRISFELLNFKNDKDFTKGATHYHHRCIKPYWIKDHIPTCALGNHIFYKL